MSKIVLCVDDSVTMQMVADITFRGTELTYVGARSADEAIEKLKGAKPALILVDANLPGKSGYDLCQQLKSDGKHSDVPVALLCGNSSPFDASRGAASGVDADVTKPWDTAAMLKLCVEIVAKGSVAKPGGAVKPAVTAAPIAAAVTRPAPAPAAAAAANTPPRSATIMGMPTIKVPGGAAAVVPAMIQPAPVAAKTTMMAAAPMVAPAPVLTSVSSSSNLASTFSAAPARAPMVSGSPTKRSALVERTLAKMAAQLAEATGLAPGSPELLGLLKLSTEVVERIVWEVVPELAEQIIRENLSALTAKRA
jgi:CheY-like chemotaxis protein